MKKNIVFFVIIFTVVFIACHKDDPLAEYSKYGYFKDIEITKDSITIDLRKDDSTFIDTNKGKMWVKLNDIYVNCYEGIRGGSCPDFGMGFRINLRLNAQNLLLRYNIELYPSNNFNDRTNLQSCKYVLIYPYEDDFQLFRTLGKTSVQYRNVYPNPRTTTEHEALLKNNGYHTQLTFIKRCD